MIKSRRILRIEIAIMSGWLAFCAFALGVLSWAYFDASPYNYDAKALCVLMGTAFAAGAAFVAMHIAFNVIDLRAKSSRR